MAQVIFGFINDVSRVFVWAGDANNLDRIADITDPQITIDCKTLGDRTWLTNDNPETLANLSRAVFVRSNPIRL